MGFYPASYFLCHMELYYFSSLYCLLCLISTVWLTRLLFALFKQYSGQTEIDCRCFALISAWSFFLSLVWYSSRVLWHFSRLMYRVFSLFISYKHLYITNSLHSCIFSYLFPMCDSCYFFRFDIFDIYLSALWCIYCYVILHFVSEWHKPPCRRFDPGSVCWISSFKFIISHVFRHAGTRSKPLYGWSLLNGLILRLGRRHF